MTIFPNYLYNSILESIIYNIYNREWFPNKNNNETIKYACVCKYWFDLVSEFSSSNMNYNNYEQLVSLIEHPSSTSLQQKPFKLIKAKNSAIYHQSLYNDPISLSKVLESSSSYSKVYINIDNSQVETRELLGVLDILPENVEVVLDISGSNFQFNKNAVDSLHKTHSIKCFYFGIDSLYTLLQSPPPKITVSSLLVNNSDFRIIHLFSLVLSFKSTSNHKIKVDDIIFPLGKFNQQQQSHLTEKLEQFTITLTIKNMLDVVSIGCDNGQYSNSSKSSNSINDKLKWEYIVNKLSNDPTLVSIKYSIFGYTNDCNGALGIDDINNGIKSILSNQKSLETFIIAGGKIGLDDRILEGIASNTSIKNLKIAKDEDNISRVLKKVFVSNQISTIRNLEILMIKGINDGWKWLEMFQDQFDLYSVSIKFLDSISFNDFFNYIKSNQFNVNQFYLVKNYNSHSYKKFFYQLNTSNSILNILDYK